MATNPQPLLPPFLGNLVEVCFVTPSIHKTIDGLSRLGIGPFHIHKFNATTVSNMTYNGKPAEFELTVAFAQQGNTTIEIMQPDSGPSLMADYLNENNNREGIQHIAFDMGHPSTSMQERIETMAERGFKPAMQGVWKGKRGECKFCFFDTKGVTGTVFETIEFSEDWVEPEGVWYPCRPEDVQDS